MTGTTAKIITPQATIINAKAISTVAEMIEQSKRMSLLCSDDRTENMWVDDELVLHYTTEGEEKQTIMSRWSLSQLCTKIGIPVKYMYKCIDEQHVKLAQTNINEWLTEFNNSRAGAVIRKCYSENTEYSRGIVSERYSLYDNSQILTAINKSVDFDNYDIRGQILTPERFHLRLTNKKKLNVKDVGDLFSGIMIDNSEVGQGALKITFMMYRLQCTNGMVMNTQAPLVYCKHYGGTIEKFSERLHTLPRLLSDAEEYMTTLIDRNIKKKMSMKEVEECFEKIKKALKMSEDGIEKLGILREIYADEMGENSFAIVNALTDFSKDFAIDRRIEIETYAGKLFKAA